MNKITNEIDSKYIYAFEGSYNMVWLITMSHTALRWQWQSVYQTLTLEKPHTLPSLASYGVSIVRNLEKTDHITTAL